MHKWSAVRQRARRDAYFESYRAHMRSSGIAELAFREKAWHCLALLAGGPDDVRAADAILRDLDHRSCHFTPMTYLQILTRHGDLLGGATRERMTAYVREALGRAASDRIHVTMYNDNFAALAAYTLVVGGELLDDPGSRAAGLRKLQGFAELFGRRGTVMEYGSPTYTPVNTHVFAALANRARDPVCRELALGCEHRMWAEIAAHWHGPSHHMAGPCSRAYWVDSVGHPHLLHALVWLVFGDVIRVNPMADLLPPHEGQVIHIGLERLMLPNMAWLLSEDCHCPSPLARHLVGKRFPAEVSMTSESLPSRITGERTWKDGRRAPYLGAPEYPAFAGPNTAYLAEDYSLAAGYSGYHDGALTETFYVTYRRKRPALRLEDTGVALARFVLNGKRPEQSNYYSVFDTVHGPEAFRNEARCWGLQKRNTALYAFRPKPFEAHEITSMELCILFPTHFGAPEEVWLGGTRDTESREPASVYVRDGPVYFAFHPLTLTDLGRQAAVRVERWPHYLAITFIHCEGAARAVPEDELLRLSSGFVAHVDAGAGPKDFEAFRERAARGRVEDTTTESEGGWTRWIRYRHPDADLEFALSPGSEGILRASVDGRPRPEPIFRVTGMNERRLPFLR